MGGKGGFGLFGLSLGKTEFMHGITVVMDLVEFIMLNVWL